MTEGSKQPPLPIVLIPAFNEADVIAEVIREIKDVCDYAVIVIDDCSTDNTAEVSQDAGATVISLAAQLGAWGATQTGMRYALRHGYEMAITMDADGQHEAQSLAMLMQPVADGLADVAIGACTERGTTLRQVAWVLMKRASGLRLEDITSGFRVYNLVALGILVEWRATLLDYQDIGVLLLMQSHGLKIVDVKINMRQRLNGKSRVFYSWATVVYYMCQTLLLGLTKRSRVQKYQPRALNE
ncbi:glycosyl transferase, family 2 [gamma proteobacterium NOR5-3]|nr:glycosyl transferase, family 2 [gamma proteobacterium NOR5-3]